MLPLLTSRCTTSFAVRGLEPLGHLRSVGDHLFERNLSRGDPIRDRLAVDVLHCDEGTHVARGHLSLVDLIDVRDVRVVERRR